INLFLYLIKSFRMSVPPRGQAKSRNRLMPRRPMGYPLFRCSIALALVFTWAISGNAQTIPDDGQPDLLVGTGAGRGLVRLLSGADGAELVSGFPWGPGATNGVRVAA